MTLLFPGWLDREVLCNYACVKIKSFRADHLTYILHLLLDKPTRNPDKVSADGFISLNSTILQRFVRNYAQYMNFLIQAGLVEIDKSYQPGVKSKGYRLVVPKDSFNSPELIPISDRTLIRKLKKRYELSKSLKDIEYVTKWLTDPRFQILKADAEEFVLKEMHKKLKSGDWDKRVVRKEGGRLQLRIDPVTQTGYLLSSIIRIAGGNFYKSLDESGNRLHTNITALKKSLRQFLLFDGQRLHSLDLKSSQPYLSLILFNEEFWRGQHQFKGFWKGRKIRKGIPISSIIMLVKLLNNSRYEEVKEFTNLLVKGEFYEWFGQNLNRSLGTNFTREEAKVQAMVVLYSDNRFIAKDEAAPKRIFRDAFPTIYELFCLIKRKCKERLACLLQQVESYLILDIICRKFTKKYPNAPIYTVHDSIATTQSFLEGLKAIIHSELLSYVGVPPRISDEIW